MRIGNIEFRKPWTRYVDIPIEQEMYYAVRKSVGEDLVADLNAMIDELQAIVDSMSDKIK